ncbi:TetR/AcrR family transcriptional regulator [Gordonia sp. OPL2]|uniref:TetR/AcrR family transcriptional regulator n=1 Tax=Gordonia sp. OPL2 TaxID=2486274 RepID=UPI0021CC8BEE|nr:TetR/AcrR family transcriptional regulator [Gordonia sp. OPL2]
MTGKARSAGKQSPAGRRIKGLDATERAQQRRELILDAALDLFTRDGYANSSIETICQMAYVGNKAFYEHFSTKEACYLELLQRNTHMIFEKLYAAPDDADDTEATLTRRLLTMFVDALADDPRIGVITFGQSGGISPTVERQRRANRRQAADLIRSVWSRFDKGPAAAGEHLAIAVTGGLFDLIADALDQSDGELTGRTRTQLADDMTDFVLTVRAGMRGEQP